jgi:hypothetical protein
MLFHFGRKVHVIDTVSRPTGRTLGGGWPAHGCFPVAKSASSSRQTLVLSRSSVLGQYLIAIIILHYNPGRDPFCVNFGLNNTGLHVAFTSKETGLAQQTLH